MDLRGCSQMHFISIIRGGEIIKVPNMIRGKPALKFLSIEEIYSSIDSKSHDSLTKYPPKVERSLAMPFGSEIKTEVKAEFAEEDELDFGAMTLSQLKDICKSHKRKPSSSVNLTTVKEEGHDLQHEEDELDLKRTLSSWKRKVQKRSKARKKGISSSKFCNPLKIKVEDAEHEHSQPQATNLILEDDPGNSTCHTVRAVERSCLDQYLNMTSGNLKSVHLEKDEHSHKDLVHPVSSEKSCCLNQVSYEHLDHIEPQKPLVSKNTKIEATNLILEDDPGNSTCHTVRAVERSCLDQYLNMTSGNLKSVHLEKDEHSHKDLVHPVSSEKSCCLNQVSYEHLDHIEPQKPLVSKNTKIEATNLILEDYPGNSTSQTVRAVKRSCLDQDLNMSSGNLKSGYLEQDQHSHKHLVHPVSSEKSCCLNQVSYEHLDHNEPKKPLISKNPKIEETIKVESSVDVVYQSLFICPSNVRWKVEKTEILLCDAPTETSLFEYDCSDLEKHHLHHPDGNTLSKIHVPCIDPSAGIEDAVITNTGEVIGSKEEGEVTRIPAIDCKSMQSVVNSENKFLSSHGMSFQDKLATAVEDEKLSVQAVTSEEVSASPLVPEKECHDRESINHEEAGRSLVEDPITEAKASRRDWENCEVVVQDENCLPSFNSVESLHNVPFAEDDNQSLTLDSDTVPPSCSPEIQHCANIDQDIGSGTNDVHNENKLVQQPPERLFSARKTISPNSKEKLRRAMDLPEMQDDNEVLSCKEKLSFEKNCVDASYSRTNPKKARIILNSKRVEALPTNDIKANTRKGKYARSLSFAKVTGKGFQGGPSIHAGSQCNSSLSCSQNAIAFSQQQMVDTERLALKLLTELHSMKEIVVDTLHSESRMCTTSKNNADKAMVVVDNVKKIEETTRWWLSIMSRDCNRFCKILEAAETNRSSPEKSNEKGSPEKEEICQNNPSPVIQQDKELSPSKNTVNREKKIMFADEAGDSLCHVKVLEAKNG